MIDHITGTICFIADNYIVLECHDIGYKIFMTKKDMVEFDRKKGFIRTIFTYYSHTEDAVKLYGFLCLRNRDLFLELLRINGVGRNTAMLIINKFNYKKFEKIKNNKSFNDLKVIKGIGKKLIETFIKYYK